MDMDSHTRFVVTAWRNSQELLQLRQDLYSSDTTSREKAVNKVFAWRLRKPDGLPLLLESTADILDVILQDGRGGLQHNALRLLYATALSRFVTGLADTQIDLTRDRPSWFPPGKSLQLPLTLLEIRHRIVHRHLPSLAELKRAATESLEWLWEWYWSQLDYAFKVGGPPEDELGVESREAVKERLQTILKTYVKERKNEIKTRKKQSRAVETALSTYNLRFSASNTTTPLAQIQRVLLQLLVEEKMILPTDKKLGSTMSGAFLIWTPLLLAFSSNSSSETPVLPVNTLFDHLIEHMNSHSATQAMVNPEMDPVKEGMHDWIVHLLTSKDVASARGLAAHQTVEELLSRLFSSPTFWNLKVAEKLLEGRDVSNKELWGSVLDAARGEGSVTEDMEVDVESFEKALPVREGGGRASEVQEKTSGPTKVMGMWKPKPIGWLPEGWSDDE
ncbi:Las1-domain-containing protein [Stemphylium lycopersici]|uniref:Las1-domain-containing protein n=1 Tax=Stemphylium lycopersici TaxID=183478 RepID=A0A364N6D5_STELY|nr:cell morphogenesis protein las1 [Stemphylium lycopersici]RAR03563.1 Las1-domain-containing protein [Stemphylium lycopersici]RAR12908.1 Las1-domain-containing protein [Stemphylium lycopersici]